MGYLDSEKNFKQEMDEALLKKTQPALAVSGYAPKDPDEVAMRSLIIRHYQLSDTIARKPRREFNDMSVLDRCSIDRMAFNTYLQNNGEPPPGDELQGWRTVAVRPVQRNKAIGMAAQLTAHLPYPRTFAYDKDSNESRESSQIMNDLIEWAVDQIKYKELGIKQILAAMTDPSAVTFSEYAEVYRKVKRKKEKIKDEAGNDTEKEKWQIEIEKDPDYCGFHSIVVPREQIYISNWQESEIQKQDFLIWRRIISYNAARTMYGEKENFKYVKPGVMIVYNDANQTFYDVYDKEMQQEMVEEIRYWNKSLDVKISMVNGIMLDDHDNPNPREDKLYPFDKFYFEMIEPNCFDGKSLMFKTQPDATLINSFYQLVMDGAHLSIFKPMVNMGGEVIAADVWVPGSITTLSSPDAKVQALDMGIDLNAGFNALTAAERSMNESAVDPMLTGQQQSGERTAKEVVTIENNAAIVMGLFMSNYVQRVRDYGKLLVGDILQYLTVGEVKSIVDGESDADTTGELEYQKFSIPNRYSGGINKTRKVSFNATLPTEPVTENEAMARNYGLLDQALKLGDNVELYEAHPKLFRELTYKMAIDADILKPRSEMQEAQDRLAIFQALAPFLGNGLDVKAVLSDFVFSAFPRYVKDANKYFAQATPQTPGTQNPNMSIQSSASQLQGMQQTPSQVAIR